MAGPASNAATIGAIWKSFGRRVTLIYLGVIAAASLLMGWAFDWVLRLAPAAGHPGAHLHGEAAAGLRPHLWAAILAAILAAYAWRGLRTWWERRRRRRPAATAPACACGTCAVRGTAPAAAAAALVLRVSGMSCGNCAQTVERALRAVPGVASATVDLAAGEATVTLAAPAAATPAALVAALAAAGYPAEAAR
jgi:copper chaperone CopZ